MARRRGYGEINVTVRNVEPPLYFFAVGRGPYFGTDQYDYAFPAMETSGTVTIDGHAYAVSGITWMDRHCHWHLPGPAG